MRFEPIAIIGQSCTLPGALTPEALWANVLAGKSSISSVSEGRWGLPRASVMGTISQSSDRTWSDVGGYVTGFRFDATGTAIPAEELLALDPLFQLTVHGVRQALRDAGIDTGCDEPSNTTGLVLGNLSFPSAAQARYAESVWLKKSPRPHPKNRFNSGLPAHLAARALGLGGGAFALDAACASSLYAIKLACDRLHDRTANLMVAGAVNQADDLFIHVGFCALSALSKTGQSRPFHRDADGLVPAEGAGFVVLERLTDALAAGRNILGVIRGVGLSNDGRGRGLLAPSEEGQERALRLAYEQAGLKPSDISLVECHATGTPVGDATELRSMARVFAGCADVPIGSLKSNLGHLITAAGVAGLIKVLAAMKHGKMPPTLHVDQTNPALAGTPFRLLREAEDWRGPKRAGISAFGFGGNNAHLIVESVEKTNRTASSFAARPAPVESQIAIVGVGARVGRGNDAGDFADELFNGKASSDARPTVAVALEGLRFPPNDLQQSLAQQTMVLEAAREAAQGVTLPRERTSVLIGMGCDAEVSRYGARWRLANNIADEASLAVARDGIVPVLQAAGVVGAMPNIPANRINSQLDVAGPAFTVSAEEASGITALQLAARALRNGEIDAALVGAVDLSHEPVHLAALTELGLAARPADAAVVLTLKRLADARRDGDPVYATLAPDGHARFPHPNPPPEGEGTRTPSPQSSPASGRGGERENQLSIPESLREFQVNGSVSPSHLGLLLGDAGLEEEGINPNNSLGRHSGAGRNPATKNSPRNVQSHGDVPLTRESVNHLDTGLRRYDERINLAASFGKSHAANGLLHVAAGALALRHGARINAGAAATPWFGERIVQVSVAVLEAAPASICLKGDENVAAWLADAPARLYVFSGNDKAGVLAALGAGRQSSNGHARFPHPNPPPESEKLLAGHPGEGTRTPSPQSSPASGRGGERENQLSIPESLREFQVNGSARLVIVAASEAELNARAELARNWLQGGGPAPEGVAFRETPITGQTAFVFTGAAAAYPGMGRELSLALPEQVAAVAARCSEMQAATDWLYGPGDGKPTHPLDQLWGTSFVCQLHAEVTLRLLSITPDATIGYSSGESNALFAMGAWNDLGEMMKASRSGTAFTEDLAGAFEAPRRAWKRLGVQGAGWANHVVAAPVEQVRAALTGEPLVHLTIINTLEDCVIGGEAAACERVVQRLGKERTLPLGYDMAAHCPEVEEIRDAWWQLHHRAVKAVPHVRFYTNASNTWFKPTSKAAADAITGQALRTLDFVKTVEQAWADGVRVFIEHGPRGLCGGWIRRILGEREHLVVSLDVAGRSGVRQLLNASAWLVAAGVKADTGALEAAIARAAPEKRAAGAMLELPAHPPAPKIPTQHGLPAPAASPDCAQVMAPAPYLEPVLGHAALRLNPPYPPLTKGGVSEKKVTDDTLSRFLAQQAQQAQLAELHQKYIEQQTLMHERFLALQQSAETGLLRAFGAASQGAVFAAPSFQTTPAANLATPAPAPTPQSHPGPKFDRAQLEVHAGGKISSVFGPQFAAQDGYARQVRMPEPPLLLADRVTGIDATPGSMSQGSMEKGTLWTETDVRADSWYLDDEGRMPAGIMIESGQADLLLISWLGIDSLNKGERVYRLLGCDLTYSGGLPVPGDTLAYDIHVDGHATQGDVRLFFFHYDCKVRGQTRLSVRNGQAGFFSDEELANSAGVLWDPLEEKPDAAQVDAPFVKCGKTRLSSAELEAFASGHPYECFGKGWETTQPHVRSPRITSEKMQFLHEVTAFDPQGGPWGRGYLRAETPVTPDDWFFKGHFKNDPCMPGTLMFEGCLQAMAIYLAGLGYTIERDGWRFEPVHDTRYPMRCRGQVTPASKHLVYEVFVSEVSAGPVPTVYADLLCTVDGRKAFHARRVGLQLVPDWPLEHWKHLGQAATQLTGEPVPLRALAGLVNYTEPNGHGKDAAADNETCHARFPLLNPLPQAGEEANESLCEFHVKPVATVDGFAFDYQSLLACAWGAPSAAFGPMYARFDGARRAARLPGPPYHFMSRVTKIDGPIGGMKQGTTVEVEYDVPVEQWYFEQNGYPTMPFCVVMEAALQPCGWLASYVGSALTTETDLLFRNLDGTGTLLHEILPASGIFKTKVKLLSISQSAGMIIENFEVECFIGEQRAFEMKTVFGFFPKEAFENQTGLPVTVEERARLAAPPARVIGLGQRPEKYCGGKLGLPGEMLLMLDRVIDFVPDGGAKKLGYLRAEKTVDADEWFFKAHFFQDPVQPGSLGVEALCQLLQFYMLEANMGEGVSNPRFEPLMLGKPVTWKYRGQVVPKNKIITTELQITEIGADANGKFAVAEGSLWVDGKRIYSVANLGMRIVGMRIVAGASPEVETVIDPASINHEKRSSQIPPPSRGRLGGGWGNDREFTHPHPNPPLEGEGVVSRKFTDKLCRIYSDNEAPLLDLAQMRRYWSNRLGISRWPIEDLYMGLAGRFVGNVVVTDPDAYAGIRGQSALYVANHQVGIESLLFSFIASALSSTTVMGLAKDEHRASWIGRLIAHGFTFPGVDDPEVIAFFDRADSGSLISIMDSLAADLRTNRKSLLVHVEGTRSLSCRAPVREIAGNLIDMALASNLPVVPVRFARGLPADPLAERIDFPLGYGRQDYWIGRPISPAELGGIPLVERKKMILRAINELGAKVENEMPAAPDSDFAAVVEDWVARTGATREHAVLYATLAELADPGDMVCRLLEGARSGRLALGDSPEDRWLAEFARPLFGPRGPEVR